jgi:hypothetical protein
MHEISNGTFEAVSSPVTSNAAWTVAVPTDLSLWLNDYNGPSGDPTLNWTELSPSGTMA